MTSHVEQIKERLSIIDVVSSYIKLEKAGINFKTRCPFHNEKTPSFVVSPSRNTYYCFGCGAKGDIFTFVEQFEGTDFKGALKTLALRAHVVLEPVDKKAQDKRDRLFRVLSDAQTFFVLNMKAGSEAADYLLERGLSNKSSEVWGVGYAPNSWNNLLLAMKKKGHAEKDILDAGLIKPSQEQKGHYDRFRGRIMFPISDSSGRVIGFSGRILPSLEKPESAKYINSPETPLYSKSRVLYGYHLAKQSIRKFGFSILVEGQMDVVLSHQAGFSNTVAVSGTALTEDQLALISRLSNNLVMAFDADTAGVSSGTKGIDRALARGMDVKVASLPPGMDPADLVASGVDNWRNVVRAAKHVIEFYLDHLCREHKDPRKVRVAVGNTVVPYIARIPHTLDQAHFVEMVASRIGVEQTPIWDAVRSAKQNASYEKGKMQRADGVETVEHIHSRRDAIVERLAHVLIWQKNLPEGKQIIDVHKLEKRLLKHIDKDRLALNPKEESLFSVEEMYAENETIEDDIEDLLLELAREDLRERYKEALGALQRAEQKGKKAEIDSALSKCKKLSEALNS